MLGCAQLCLLGDGQNPTRCACEPGWELDSDGRSCNGNLYSF